MSNADCRGAGRRHGGQCRSGACVLRARDGRVQGISARGTYAYVLLMVLNAPADKYIGADLSAAGLAIGMLSKPARSIRRDLQLQPGQAGHLGVSRMGGP